MRKKNHLLIRDDNYTSKILNHSTVYTFKNNILKF